MGSLQIFEPAAIVRTGALLLALAAWPLHAVAQPREPSVTVGVDVASSSAPLGPIHLSHAIEGENAAAMADHGLNSASASMWGDRPCCGHGTGSAGSLGASSSWEDKLRVLTSEAAPGEWVVVAFSIGLHGHMERTKTFYVSSNAQVRHSMGLNYHGSWITKPGFLIDSPSEVDFSLDVDEIQQGAFKVQNGQWFNLISTLSVNVEGSFSGPWDQSFEVESSFGNTVRWLGGHVERLDGTPLSAFTIEPASGFDYVASPIPEPATLALFAPGVLGLLLLRRRFRAGA